MQADKWMRRCVGRVSDDARFQTFRHTDTDGKASPLTVIPPILIERTTKPHREGHYPTHDGRALRFHGRVKALCEQVTGGWYVTPTR